MLRNPNSGSIAISKERVDIQETIVSNNSKAKINSTKIKEEEEDLKEEVDSEEAKEV